MTSRDSFHVTQHLNLKFDGFQIPLHAQLLGGHTTKVTEAGIAQAFSAFKPTGINSYKCKAGALKAMWLKERIQ